MIPTPPSQVWSQLLIERYLSFSFRLRNMGWVVFPSFLPSFLPCVLRVCGARTKCSVKNISHHFMGASRNGQEMWVGLHIDSAHVKKKKHAHKPAYPTPALRKLSHLHHKSRNAQPPRALALIRVEWGLACSSWAPRCARVPLDASHQTYPPPNTACSRHSKNLTHPRTISRSPIATFSCVTCHVHVLVFFLFFFPFRLRVKLWMCVQRKPNLTRLGQFIWFTPRTTLTSNRSSRSNVWRGLGDLPHFLVWVPTAPLFGRLARLLACLRNNDALAWSTKRALMWLTCTKTSR